MTKNEMPSILYGILIFCQISREIYKTTQIT